MSRVRSIETMRVGLAEALVQSDWLKAGRYIERLKGIIIDAVVQDEPVAIRLAGHALQQSGERLELVANLPMVLDAAALAWQLRADASLAALAARVRPGYIERDGGDEAGDVPDLLMRELQRNNAPMSNSDLASRTGKDPATVSRTLIRMERGGKIRRWRANGRKLNAPIRSEMQSDERLNAQRFFTRQATDANALKAAQAQSQVIAPLINKTPINYQQPARVKDLAKSSFRKTESCSLSSSQTICRETDPSVFRDVLSNLPPRLSGEFVPGARVDSDWEVRP